MTGRREPGRLRTLMFRALMLGYPRVFRRAYAEELVLTFDEAWREEAGGPVAATLFWLRILRDGVMNGSRMRLRLRQEKQQLDISRHDDERRRSSVLAAMIQGTLQDARLAVRALRTQSAAAAAVVLTLALGIGAATAIFTVVDALLLRPLPFAEPDRLIEMRRHLQSGSSIDRFPVAVAAGLLDDTRPFAAMAAHARIDGVLTGEGEARQLFIRAAGPELFETLGRAPQRGRVYSASEAEQGAHVMVIADRLWSTLGRDPDVIGRRLEFDGDRYEVIGVMPPDFRFPTVFAADAFVPMSEDFRAAGVEQSQVSLLARLPAGMDTLIAVQRLNTAVNALPRESALAPEWTPAVMKLGAWRANPDARRALWLVAGAVTLMLLIAIMNATNLLLTRVSTRAREFAVRHSLGATAPRLLRQLVTESLILALLAGMAAIGLAYAGVQVLMRFAPPELTDLAANAIIVDQRVLLFAFATTALAGFLLGVLPALAASAAARRRIGLSLSVYAGATRERHRVRSGLVIAQVAMAVTLLVAAGLLATSFMRVMRVDAGMDLDRTVLLMISPNHRDFPNDDAVRALAMDLEERIAALPGVEAVTRADGLPPSASFSFGLALQAEEDAEPRQGADMLPFVNVRPDFLPTLGTRIIEGRNFTEGESRESNVAIIDRDFARFFWGQQPAVGRRFRIDAESPWLTVVGVVDELMLGGPDNSRGEFALLRPAPHDLAYTFFAIRARGDAGQLIQPVREVVRTVAPDQPIWNLWTARAAVSDEVSAQRFFMMLMVTLGSVSLLLAAVGLYSLLAFVVSRRTREMGIRMALGARAPSVIGLVIRQGLLLACIGVMLGLAGALAGARLIESLLYDTSPQHPIALSTIAAIMIAVAVIASMVPAIRASRLDPMGVLRQE